MHFAIISPSSRGHLAYKFRTIGPIYYEYGSLILTYDNADIAVKAFYMLRELCYDGKNLLVLVLPNIAGSNNIRPGVRVSVVELLPFFAALVSIYPSIPLAASFLFACFKLSRPSPSAS